jgi:RimJ/RimL family protein N-acetyltransferase
MDHRHPVLEGVSIRLEPLDPGADLRDYVRWVNDPETTRFMWIGHSQLGESDIREYIESFQDKDDRVLYGIMTRDDGRHVGNITLQSIDRNNSCADIGIMIGATDVRGRGVGTEAIGLVADYALAELGLHRVYAGYVDDNLSSAGAFRKNGFVVEGRSREAFELDGEYRDVVRVGLLETDPR